MGPALLGFLLAQVFVPTLSMYSVKQPANFYDGMSDTETKELQELFKTLPSALVAQEPEFLYALGMKSAENELVFLLALDSSSVVNTRIKVNTGASMYGPSCTSLPPPTYWLKACFKFKFEAATGNSQAFRACGNLDLKIASNSGTHEFASITLRCFQSTPQGDTSMEEFLNFEDDDEDEFAIVKAVPNHDAFAALFKKMKMDRAMQIPQRDNNYDSKDEPVAGQDDGRRGLTDESQPVGEGTPTQMERINWWQIVGDELPYLAVLFKGFIPPSLANAEGLRNFDLIVKALEEATGHWGTNRQNNGPLNVFEPGNACGGALLTPDTVLTLCACVATFYFKVKHTSAPSGGVSMYDINASDIFLEFSKTQFSGSQYYRLDHDPSRYKDWSSCFKASGSHEGYQALMVAMPFTPRIENPNPQNFVLWPPYPIHEKYKQSDYVQLVAFGMHSMEKKNFTDDNGNIFDPPINAVSIGHHRCKAKTQRCSQDTFQNPEVPSAFKDKTTCFCANYPKIQLCKSVIGFPLTHGDELAGLSASPMSCEQNEGTVMGAVFYDGIVKEISDYVKKDIKTRRMAFHTYLYREPAEIVHIIPDYSTSDTPPKSRRPGPASGADGVFSSWIALGLFTIFQIARLV